MFSLSTKKFLITKLVALIEKFSNKIEKVKIPFMGKTSL